MSLPLVPEPNPVEAGRLHGGRYHDLHSLVETIEQRVRRYLQSRTDNEEQTDHLRHVADRTRWLYSSELQRANPGAMVRITEHEDVLIQVCVLSHDIGKWVPRDELRALAPPDLQDLEPTFAELKFTAHQSGLFLLALRRRFGLPQDGYTPEYDSAHHLVSAFMLVKDEQFGFHHVAPADQARLITMIVGHQFGGYFKESLLNLSLHNGSEVTTGMLMDVSRPDRLQGDLLACAFHDADISDLLFVGSLERRPNREDIFHAGGLIKILMINFTNCINQVPQAPTHLEGCLRSCQATVHGACKEFITQTAVDHGQEWRQDGRRFLTLLREKPVYDKINDALLDAAVSAADRLTSVRSLTRLQARSFLTQIDDAAQLARPQPGSLDEID
jgi:hypothetical protein